jgi:hypothetical protein
MGLGLWLGSPPRTGGTPTPASVAQLSVPYVTTTAGTAQMGSRNAQAGTYSNAASVTTTFLRFGVVVSSPPVSITASNAKDVFWVKDTVLGTDGLTYVFLSDPHEIDTDVPAATLYDGFQIICTSRNDGTPVQYEFLQIQEMQALDKNGISLTGGVAITSFSGVVDGFPVTNIIDGDPFTGAFWTPSAYPSTIIEMCNCIFVDGQRPLEGATFSFVCSDTQGPGDFKVYPIIGTTPDTTALLEVTGPHDFSVDYQPLFSVPGAGALNITSLVYDAGTNETSFVLSGVVTQAKVRVIDRTDADHPILVSDWADVDATDTVPAEVGGLLVYQFYDTNEVGSVIESGEKNVVGKPEARVSINAGTWHFLNYWNPYVSCHADLMDRAIWVPDSGYTGRIAPEGPAASACFDRYNRLISWPVGITYIRIPITWSMHANDAGVWEWVNGGVYTRAGHGTTWVLENPGGAPVSVDLSANGPNGGIKFTIGSDSQKPWYITLYSLPAPMTVNTMRKIGETDASWTVTQDWIDSKSIYNGDIRYMWAGLEGFWNWGGPPWPSASDASAIFEYGYTWDQYHNNFPDWADRQRAGRFRPEIAIETSNRTGRPTWWNIPWVASDDYVHGFFAFVRDELDPSLDVPVAVSNEVWNPTLGEHHAFFYHGYCAGYNGDTPSRTPRTVVRNGSSDHHPTALHPQGTLVYSYLYGTLWASCIFLARQDTTGMDFPTGGVGLQNADWICVARSDLPTKVPGYEQYGNGPAAVYRYQGEQLARIIAIGKQYIEPGRLRAVFEGFALWDLNYNEATDGVTQGLTFAPVDGGEALLDVAEGYIRHADAPYVPDSRINCVTVDATPGATRQTAIIAYWAAQWTSNGAPMLTGILENRAGLATILSTPRTVNGVSKRYSMSRADRGYYEFGDNVLLFDDACDFVGSISGNQLTVSSLTFPTDQHLAIGQYIFTVDGSGNKTTTTRKITALGTGTGGTGTYTLSGSATAAGGSHLYAGSDAALLTDLNLARRSAALEPTITAMLDLGFSQGGSGCMFDEGTIESTQDTQWNWFDKVPENFASPPRGRAKALVDFCGTV